MKGHAPLRAGIAVGSVAAHAVGDIQFRHAQAVLDPVVARSARQLCAASKFAQRSAFHQQVPPRAAAAFVA